MAEAKSIIIYQSEDGRTKLEVPIDAEIVWLSQKQMAILFDCSVDNIALHLKNILAEGELDARSTSEDSSVVQKEGRRNIKRTLKLYNLNRGKTIRSQREKCARIAIYSIN